MKFLFGTLLLISFSLGSILAQNTPCYFDQLNSRQSLQKAELKIQEGILSYKELLGEDSIKLVPIVVHVIHEGGRENISEEQIISQIEVLNEDFSRQEGTNGYGAGVDMGLRFFLANIDPEGNCTNGIVRINSPLTIHEPYQRGLLKDLSYWDSKRYLNMYIVKDITGSIAGYSSFPEGPSVEDGIVVQHIYFGKRTGSASNSWGRTTTHEIGHWLGLYHTFQNSCETDTCLGGDMVCDTPPAIEPNFSCETLNTCHNDFPDLDDPKENYMDYTPDLCKNMFSAGQKVRAQSTMTRIRTEIWSEQNLISTGYDSLVMPPSDCPLVVDFVTSNTEICYGQSVYFSDKTLNDATQWWWNFPGGIPDTSSEQNPTVVYDNIGEYDVSLVVSNGFSSDSIFLDSYIQVNTPALGKDLTFKESFDSGLSFPDGITINNPDEGITWELDSTASASGDYSIRINNLINTNYGSIDEIELEFLDFTTAPNDGFIYMSFNWASARSNPLYTDRLIVLLSTDCGTNYKRIYSLSGESLTTGPIQTTAFIPDSTQWKDAFIFLGTYKNYESVLVKIVNVTEGGNQLFIDDIYIGTGSDLVSNEDIGFNDSPFTTYPNPVFDKINISFSLGRKASMAIQLFNAQGHLMRDVSRVSYPSGDNHVIVDTKDLPKGIYFLNLQGEKNQKGKRLIIW